MLLNESQSEDKSLETFLTNIALNAEPDSEETEDRVSLMTIHSSKGLSLVVFLAGMKKEYSL